MGRDLGEGIIDVASQLEHPQALFGGFFQIEVKRIYDGGIGQCWQQSRSRDSKNIRSPNISIQRQGNDGKREDCHLSGNSHGHSVARRERILINHFNSIIGGRRPETMK